MTEINREHFEAYLLNLSDEARFQYTHCESCLIGSFLRRFQRERFAVGPRNIAYFDAAMSHLDIPSWLLELIDHIRAKPDYCGIITGKSAKESWLALYGDPHPIPLRADGTPDLGAILKL